MVLKELPDKTRTYMSCELTNRKEYEKAEEDVVNYLKKYKNAEDEKIKKAAANEAIVKIGVLRRVTAEGKLSEAKKIIKDYLSAEKNSSFSQLISQ